MPTFRMPTFAERREWSKSHPKTASFLLATLIMAFLLPGIGLVGESSRGAVAIAGAIAYLVSMVAMYIALLRLDREE